MKDIIIIILVAIAVYLLIWDAVKKNRKQLGGDFSSFTHWCPVKDCGWSFQTDEDFAAHILKNKHGVDIT